MTDEELETLLPWYVNRTCNAAEAARVETARDADPAVARELDDLAAVAQAVRTLHERTPQPSPLLRARISATIERAPTPQRWAAWKWAAVAAPWAAILVLALVVNGPKRPPIVAGPFTHTVDVDKEPEQGNRSANGAYRPPAAGPANGVPGGPEEGPQMTVDHPPKQLIKQPAFAAGSAAANAAHGIAPRAPRSVAIARTADVTLTVADVDATLPRLEAVATGNGGDVLNLEYTSPERPELHHAASLQMRVDARQFDAAMTALASIGTIAARTVKAEDVGDQIVDANARLRNLRQTESDLLRIMHRSGSISDVLEAENQVSTVREQIEQLQASLAALGDRVSYSVINLIVADDRPSAVAPGGITIADAWRGAVAQLWQFTLAAIAAAFTVLVFLPYVALAALAVAGIVAGVRSFRRGR